MLLVLSATIRKKNDGYYLFTIFTIILVNLETNHMCPITFPTDKFPVVLEYLPDIQQVAVCGADGDKNDKSCATLTADKIWKDMPSLANEVCPYTSNTRSTYLDGYGWLVFGKQKFDRDPVGDFDICRYRDAQPTFQVRAPGGAEWSEVSIASPFSTGNYPQRTCTLTLNSTHVLMMGGYSDGLTRNEAWILDVTDNTWTQIASLPDYRQTPGCVVTESGDILVVGGYNARGQQTNTTFTYNLANDAWTQQPDFPLKLGKNSLLMWKKRPILLRFGNEEVWIMREDKTWETLPVTLGNRFHSLAVMVPNDVYKCGQFQTYISY